jgi:hypothetical protein
MNLTEAEIAYLRRFEFESWFNLFGPGTVHDECRELATNEVRRKEGEPAAIRTGYLSDMAMLATPSIQYQVLGEVQFETDPTKFEDKYPKVPFPWESLDALHQRVLELDPLSQPREQGEDVPVPGAKSALTG